MKSAKKGIVNTYGESELSYVILAHESREDARKLVGSAIKIFKIIIGIMFIVLYNYLFMTNYPPILFCKIQYVF
jgi:hypothetical protein